MGFCVDLGHGVIAVVRYPDVGPVEGQVGRLVADGNGDGAGACRASLARPSGAGGLPGRRVRRREHERGGSSDEKR